jgi:hypothetical protein
MKPSNGVKIATFSLPVQPQDRLATVLGPLSGRRQEFFLIFLAHRGVRRLQAIPMTK